jgi:hypothetical protein
MDRALSVARPAIFIRFDAFGVRERPARERHHRLMPRLSSPVLPRANERDYDLRPKRRAKRV